MTFQGVCSLNLALSLFLCRVLCAPFPLRSSPHHALCSASRAEFSLQRRAGAAINVSVITAGILFQRELRTCRQSAALTRSLLRPSITSFETLLGSVSRIVLIFFCGKPRLIRRALACVCRSVRSHIQLLRSL